MGNTETESCESRVFKGSGFWIYYVWGSVYMAVGNAILISVVFGIALWETHKLKAVLLVSAMEVAFLGTALYLLLGDGIARYPYAITIEHGKGLRLYAPFKEIYIPIGDIKDVRAIYLGFRVRLNRRHRLLTEFVIHSFFGKAWSVADAITAEIQGRDRQIAF